MRPWTAALGGLLLALTLPSPAHPAAGTCTEGPVTYSFQREAGLLSFEGSFSLANDPGTVMDALFDFSRIREHAKSASSITLSARGPGWQDLRYCYCGLLFTLDLTFRKTLDRDRRRISFVLTDTRQRGILPPVLSSDGFYELRPEGEGYRFVFFQQGEIGKGVLRDTYLKRLQKDGRQAMLDLYLFLTGKPALELAGATKP